MVRPSIVILNKGEQAESFRSLLITGKIPSSLDDAMIVNGVESDAAAMHQPEWVFQSAANTRLFQRIVSQGRLLADVVDGRLYMGIKTGLAEAFVVDGTVGNALVANSPDSAQIIRPTVAGQDLRPWYQENEERWLIRIPAGWTRQTIGAELSAGDAWKWLAKSYPNLATHLSPFAAAASGRYDKGEYWWELRSCDYYDAFDQTKIIWPDIAKLPRFSQDDAGTYLNNTAYFIPTDDQSLLGILQSRVIWFVISQISQPLRERAGLWQYRLFPQFLERLPIPDLSSEDRVEVAGLATQLGVLTRDRYNLHRKARNRIVSDFGSPGTRLNQKLTAWWTLDFSAFRAEVKKALKADIPVKERDQWEDFLTTNRADHDRLAAAIVARETDLNARVYALFALSLADIRLIEESTKYPYGEV
ncbi:MAG: TaqI-like C-terminal specificity domain-containing protein [Thermomicrobiales bacterium]